MNFDATYKYFEWEMELLKSIQSLHADWLTPILKFICDITMHGEMWIALGIVLALYKKTRKTGVTMLLAMLLGTITADIILKPLVQRPRPFQQYVDMEWILFELNEKGKRMVTFVDTNKIGFDFYIKKLPSDWSFPSGHSVCGFSASIALLTRNKKAAIPALIMACSIAFGRMYLFVHFPTDVFTGICIGTFWGIISYFVINAVYKKMGKEQPAAEKAVIEETIISEKSKSEE